MIVFGLVIAVVATVAIWLLFRPISLGFAQPAIEQALNDNLPNYTSTIDEVVLVWSGWEEGADIRALNFKVTDEQGEVLAQLPELAIGFETTELLKGRLAPDSLKVIGPHLTLLRREDGSMGFGDVATGGGDYEAVIAQAVGILLTRPDTGGLDRLRSIRVVQAHLTIKDIADHRDWEISDVDFEISKSATGLSVILKGGLASDETVSALDARLNYDRDSNRLTINLDIEDLVPSAFARDFGFWQTLNGIDVPLTASFQVEAGAGFKIDTVAFDLTLGQGRVNLPGLFSAPLGVSTGRLVGKLDRDAGTLTLDSYRLVFGGASVSGKGDVYLADDGEGYRVDLNIVDMPFTTLARLWPTTFKPFSRGWLARNVTTGVIRNMEGRFDLKPGFVPGDPLPAGTFDAAFSFDGLTVHYLRPMPPLVEARGTGTFTEKRLDIQVDKARVKDQKTGMDINIRDGRAFLDDLNIKGMHYGSVVAHASGDVSDLVYITTFEPLKFAQAYSVDPSGLGGTGEATIKVEFPLLRKLLFSDVDLKIDGKVEGFRAEILDGRTEITQGDMALMIDSNHLEAHGKVSVGGLAFDASWKETFVRGDGFGSDVSLKGKPTTGELTEALGFTVPFPGSIGVTLEMQGNGLNITQGKGILDFAETSMGIAQVDWAKDLGQSAELFFDFVVEEDGLNVSKFDLVSEGMNAAGSAMFGFSFTPRSIKLDYLLAGNNNLSADLKFGPDGTAITGRAGGKVIDFRPVIDTLFNESEDMAGFDIEVDLSFDQAIAHDGVRLHELLGLLRIENSKLRDIHLAGLFKDSSSFVVSSIPYPLETAVEVHSDNAGQLIRALGIFGGADGGVMVLNAITDTSTSGGATTGRVKIADFNVTRSPGLAQVLNFGSITGIRDIMSGSGISFHRFDLGFSLDHGELTFKDAVALGPSVGLRMSGRLYDDLGLLAIEGMIIPAYTINTIIRSVPIVGDILTGGGQEGVFGVDFTMSGAVSDPEVKVDTASILAPGFIKGIFGAKSTAD